MAVPSTAITRLDLSATFSEFDLAMSRKGFIGAKACQPILVGAQSADVGKITIESMLQTGDDTRAPGAGYKRGDFEFTKFSYATDDHGREAPLDDRTLRIYRDLIDAEGHATQRAIDQVLRNYEIACAALLYDTNTWTGAALTLAITEEWDTANAAVPINDVETARQKMLANSGLMPNALICNRKQFFNLAHTDQVVGLIKFWGGDDPKRINAAMVAAVLDLDFVLVAGGDNVMNAANEGQSASPSSIWSDEYAMLARVAVTDDPQEPCVARTFMWDEENAGALGSGEELALVVEEYREEHRRSSVVRARNDRDLVVMYPEAAFLFSNVTTI